MYADVALSDCSASDIVALLIYITFKVLDDAKRSRVQIEVSAQGCTVLLFVT